MRSFRGISIAFASLAVMAAPAEARDICWIDRIERTTSGVRVFFSEPRIVYVKGVVKSTVLDVDQSKPEGGLSDRQLPLAKSIEVVPGDQIRTTNNHDGCTMTFRTQGDAAGLWVENWYMPPPTSGAPVKPGQQTKFIPAQK